MSNASHYLASTIVIFSSLAHISDAITSMDLGVIYVANSILIKGRRFYLPLFICHMLYLLCSKDTASRRKCTVIDAKIQESFPCSNRR